MIKALTKGWLVLTEHSKLWLILVLIVVFPAIYLYSFSEINALAYKNLETIELNRVQGFHNLVQSLYDPENDHSELLSTITAEQEDIKVLQIAREINGELIVVFDLNRELKGSKVENLSPYKSALIQTGETFSYQYDIDGKSILQAFRAITISGETFYIFTEHDFTSLAERINNRIYNSYWSIAYIFIFLLGLAYWISKQINFEVQYHKAKQDIAERDLFTNSLAHELRAPLTAMRGYASMIEESNAVPKSEQEYAKKINQSATRLVTLISDFLEAARIQSGKLNLEVKECEVTELITNVVKTANILAEKKNLALNTDLPSQSTIIRTDSGRLEQILTNLISNAIKYTDAGSISVKLTTVVNKVVITIADTGGGISAEDQKKLFQPFVRVGDTKTQNNVTGTGLGMWITKKLVEQLGGTIGLESIKDVGTHVVLTFPLK